ncbi:MAG TPA: hypothetical protein VME46_05260 [Acidimicrobiales bacterium]|nr:hypothetical protein [Acidimicrobiales bacterium]
MLLVTESDIATLIANAWRPPHLTARKFVRAWGSGNLPVLYECDAGQWVVKAPRTDRPAVARNLVAEQVVSRLGVTLGAAVPEPAIVDVPREVAPATMVPGPAHGSRYIPGLGPFRKLPGGGWPSPGPHVFATAPLRRLALLHEWVWVQDHELHAGAGNVFGVDYEAAFGSRPWSLASLRLTVRRRLWLAPFSDNQSAPPTQDDLAALQAMSDETVAAAVAACPDEWGASSEERAAVVEYLLLRRDWLVSTVIPQPAPVRVHDEPWPLQPWMPEWGSQSLSA